MTTKFIPKKEALAELESKFPDFKPHYIAAIQALFQLTNDLEKSMDAHFNNHCRFSRARYLILVILMNCQSDGMAPHEIAKELSVTRGNMTGLIDGLLKDGYVTKRVDEEDRRQVWIQVTDRGKERMNEILPNYFARMAKFMSVLKKEEIEMLTKLANKLKTSVSSFVDPEA